MLTDIAFGVAELVGEDESLAILAQRHAPVFLQRMNRHGEEAEVHWTLRHSGRAQRGPESITTILSLKAMTCRNERTVVMDSGLAPTARPGMTITRFHITQYRAIPHFVPW